jgi:serine/threonine protein phosphatase PrpC
MTSPPKLDCYGTSDAGKVRKANEDQFLIAELSKSMLIHLTSLPMEDSTRLVGRRPGYLFLVADGLGAGPAGERASRLAVDSAIRTLLGTMPWFYRLGDHEGDLEDELKRVLEQCQTQIDADVAENPSRSGMGTTLTMAYVIWPRLYVVHVGDARCYLFRNGRLQQLTKDHTVIAPSPGAGEESPVRKVLWNVVGGETEEVWPDVYKATLQEGDTLLLATDGLTREVPDSGISEILSGTPSAVAACTELVEAANQAGGRDNITVVVARFGKKELQEAPPLEVAAAATVEELPEAASGLEVREAPGGSASSVMARNNSSRGGSAERDGENGERTHDAA